MQAFHNDVKVQKKYLSRIRAHAKADEFIKGTYWEKGKGCAVGCTVHSSDHGLYETEMGIPRWVARLEDRIFEGLPNVRAKTWPVEFLEAVNLGSDLSKIFIPMLIFICESAREKTRNELSISYIDGVLFELKKDVIDREKLLEARRQSRPSYAAYAAAAYAAAAAAYAAAAYAAAAAAYADAADAAAYAAAAAYADAARQNEYVKFADKLLELIRECKL